MEAWVYPLEILRSFRLQFEVDGRLVSADVLARTVTLRPEFVTILYAPPGTASVVFSTRG